MIGADSCHTESSGVIYLFTISPWRKDPAPMRAGWKRYLKRRKAFWIDRLFVIRLVCGRHIARLLPRHVVGIFLRVGMPVRFFCRVST
jgi:hypothetical protein